MNIKQLIKNDIPNFTGIVVADGAADLTAIQNLKQVLLGSLIKIGG